MSALLRRHRFGALMIAFCVAGAGVGAVVQGQDGSFDLRNYHWYNAFAILSGRHDRDIAPAQMQSWLNPLLDLPFYGLVRSGIPPIVVTVVMGGVSGIGWFLSWLCIGRLMPGRTLSQRLARCAAFAIGITGAAGWSLLGSSSNDWYLAVASTLAVFLVIRAITDRQHFFRMFASAGFVMGAVNGLKMTALPFAIGIAVGILIAMYVVRPSIPLAARSALVYGAGFAPGFLFTDGWWMAFLFSHYGNPLFPFFNTLFRSPFAEIRHYPPYPFVPLSLSSFVAFPFRLLHTAAGVASEPPMRDYRIVASGVIGLLCVVRLLWKSHSRCRQSSGRIVPKPEWAFVAATLVVSYAAWLCTSAVYRFFIAQELLLGVTVVAGVGCLLSNKQLAALSTLAVTVILVGVTVPPRWERIAHGTRFFDIQAPQVPSASLVVMTGNAPASYLISFFDPGVRFVSVNNNFQNPSMTNAMQKELRTVIDRHQGAIFSLDLREEYGLTRESDAVLAAYGLERAASKCRIIPSNMDTGAFRICELKR